MEWLQNPEIDKMIDAARATGDAAAQTKIYKDLQQNLIDEQTTRSSRRKSSGTRWISVWTGMSRCRCNRSTMPSTSTSGHAAERHRRRDCKRSGSSTASSDARLAVTKACPDAAWFAAEVGCPIGISAIF